MLGLSSYGYYASLTPKPNLFKKFSIPVTIQRHATHLSYYLSSRHPQIWIRTSSPNWKQCQQGPPSQAERAYYVLGKELHSLGVGVNRIKGTVPTEVQSINKYSLAIPRQVAPVPGACYLTERILSTSQRHTE